MRFSSSCLTAFLLAVLVANTPDAGAAETRTLKERLSNKASDEQRVDNCKVPAERRGPVPRPECPIEDAGSAAAAGQEPDAPVAGSPDR